MLPSARECGPPCQLLLTHAALVTAACVPQLEFIGGEVWANVWQTDCIARICPDSGRVKAWLLMHELRDKLMRRNLGAMPMDVLNGEAARCPACCVRSQRLLLTG